MKLISPYHIQADKGTSVKSETRTFFLIVLSSRQTHITYKETNQSHQQNLYAFINFTRTNESYKQCQGRCVYHPHYSRTRLTLRHTESYRGRRGTLHGLKKLSTDYMRTDKHIICYECRMVTY